MSGYNSILVTGGCGFIGSHFVRHMRRHYPEISLINVDLLTYAAQEEAVKEFCHDPQVRFVQSDVADAGAMSRLVAQVDAVVHFAAESHVDRSIADPGIFVRTNVTGTQVLLDAALTHGIKRYVQISTDEVYGSLGKTGKFTEETPLAANSPYSASKAGADLLVRAYHETYGLPTVITRCSNNYGPWQFDEKLIPTLIRKALANEPLPLYGDGENVRDWLYVEDHCRAIATALFSGEPGEIYNVGGSNEWRNVDIAKEILRLLGKPESLVTYVTDRLGHDRRYAIDSRKIQRDLGWSPEVDFGQGLTLTVEWYRDRYTRPL